MSLDHPSASKHAHMSSLPHQQNPRHRKFIWAWRCVKMNAHESKVPMHNTASLQLGSSSRVWAVKLTHEHSIDFVHLCGVARVLAGHQRGAHVRQLAPQALVCFAGRRQLSLAAGERLACPRQRRFCRGQLRRARGQVLPGNPTPVMWRSKAIPNASTQSNSESSSAHSFKFSQRVCHLLGPQRQLLKRRCTAPMLIEVHQGNSQQANTLGN